MLALDFVQGIAQCSEEVVVGRDDGSVHIELDHCLRLADSRNLSLVVGIEQLLLRYVGSVLYDLEGFAVEVEDRVVGGLNPDFLAALADAFVFGRVVFAPVQLGPEFFVGGALFVSLVDEQAMVLALDFIQGIAESLEKVLIGCDDGSVHVELDYRLCLVDGCNLAGPVVVDPLLVELGCFLSSCAVHAILLTSLRAPAEP